MDFCQKLLYFRRSVLLLVRLGCLAGQVAEYLSKIAGRTEAAVFANFQYCLVRFPQRFCGHTDPKLSQVLYR